MPNGAPHPYIYNVNRQLVDESWRPINKVMFVDETYTPATPSGDCTSEPVQQGDANSSEFGTFGPDLYHISGSPPNPCTSSSTQSFVVTLAGQQYTIQTTYAVTWRFSHMTVSCLAGCQ